VLLGLILPSMLCQHEDWGFGNMKTISMIIPHYNDSARCIQLLDSLKENFFKEIILVDDASELYHVEVLNTLPEKFASLPLKLILLESQNGAGKARNVGLSHLTSDYVIFVDSDDVLTDNHTEILTEAMNQERDVVYVSPTSHTLDDQLGKRHSRYQGLVESYLNTPNPLNEAKLCTHFFIPVSKIISVSFIKEFNIQFDEVLVSNDVMFSTKLGIHARKIGTMTSPFYNILEHNTGLTQRKDKESLFTRVRVFVEFVKLVQEHYEKEIFDALDIRGDSLVVQAYKAQGKHFAKEVRLHFEEHGVSVSKAKIFLKHKIWL
jgi:glycosyltransferase involved in cell wall biosynthesis